MIPTSMGKWREQLADTPETGVQVQLMISNVYFYIMCVVKSSLTAINKIVKSSKLRRRFESQLTGIKNLLILSC